MSTAIEELPKTDELEGDAQRIIAKAQAIKIVDDTTFKAAGETLRDFKTYQKRVEETFDPLIKAQNDAVKATRAMKARFAGPVEEAELLVKRKLANYQTEQEAKRRAEEAAARERAAKEAEERKLAEAVALDQAGDKQAAEAVLDAPTFVPPPVQTRAAPKVEGVSFKSQWKFEVFDPNIVPRDFLKVDEVKLGQHVRAHKASAVGAIAGVRVWEEKSVAAAGF